VDVERRRVRAVPPRATDQQAPRDGIDDAPLGRGERHERHGIE